MSDDDRVPVTFLQSYNKWNANEVAGFKPEYAARLVAAGIAKYLHKEDKRKAEGALKAAAESQGKKASAISGVGVAGYGQDKQADSPVVKEEDWFLNGSDE